MAYAYTQQVPSPSGFGYPIAGNVNNYPVYNPLTGTTAGSVSMSELPSDVLTREAMAGQIPWVSTNPNQRQAGIMGSVAPPLARTLPAFNSLVKSYISGDTPLAPMQINLGAQTPYGSPNPIVNTSGGNSISDAYAAFLNASQPRSQETAGSQKNTGGEKAMNLMTKGADTSNLIAKPPPKPPPVNPYAANEAAAQQLAQQQAANAAAQQQAQYLAEKQQYAALQNQQIINAQNAAAGTTSSQSTGTTQDPVTGLWTDPNAPGYVNPPKPDTPGAVIPYTGPANAGVGGQSIIPGGMTPQQFAGTQGGVASTLANQGNIGSQLTGGNQLSEIDAYNQWQQQMTQNIDAYNQWMQGQGGQQPEQSFTQIPNLPPMATPAFGGSPTGGGITGAGGISVPAGGQDGGQQGQGGQQSSYPGSFNVDFSVPTPQSVTQPLERLGQATGEYLNQVPAYQQQLFQQMNQQQEALSNPDVYNAIIQRSMGGAQNVSRSIMDQFLPQQQAVSGMAINQASGAMSDVYRQAMGMSQSPGLYNPISQAAERGGQQVRQSYDPSLQLAESGLLTNPYERAAIQANQQTAGTYGGIYQGLEGKLTQDMNDYMASLGGATQPEAAARIVSGQLGSAMAPYLAEQAKSQAGIYQQSALGQAGTLTDLLKNQALQEGQAQAGIYGTAAGQIGQAGTGLISQEAQQNAELQKQMALQQTQNLSNLQNVTAQQAIQTAGGGIPGMLQQAQTAAGKSGQDIQQNLLRNQQDMQQLQKQAELMQQGYTSGLNQVGYEARTGIQDVGQQMQLAMSQNQADYTNQLMQSELARQQSALQEQSNRQVRGAYEYYNDMMKNQAEANQQQLQGVYNQMYQQGGSPTIYGTYQPGTSYNTPTTPAANPSTVSSSNTAGASSNTGGGTGYTPNNPYQAGGSNQGGSSSSVSGQTGGYSIDPGYFKKTTKY